MNFYEWHIGDWLKKCAHLSAIEEGIYRRLLDWYYSHEKAIPLSMRDAYRAARCVSPQERKAVQRVLHEFFEVLPDGWHQNRADRAIAKYRNLSPVAQANRIAARERSAKAREKRSKLFAECSARGLSPSWNATNAEIEGLLAGTHDTARDTAQDVPSFTANTSHNPEARAVTDTVTARAGDTATPVASRAGKVCLAMKRQGLQAVNPGDPRLHNLFHAGVTDDELEHTAAEAVALGKNWGWLLATVKGRREDADRQAQEAAKPGRKRANGQSLGDWVPNLMRPPQKPGLDGEVIDADA